MGVNNRARRAAKKRKRSAGTRPEGQATHRSARDDPRSGYAEPSPAEIADWLVAEGLDLVADDRGAAGDVARQLLDTAGDHREALVGAVRRQLGTAAARAGRAGWTPNDLGELVRRRVGHGPRPLLAHLLQREVERHPAQTVAGQWRDEIVALGGRDEGRLDTPAGLTVALALADVLRRTPTIPALVPAPGLADPLDELRRRAGADGGIAKVLARVRGLLAKAESTDFPEEAEALSAKAQELVSRHALDHLLAEAQEPGPDSAVIVSRRLWIDAPYVEAKANLVHQVAIANGCSTVISQRLGFTTVAGTAMDLAAVELLATSLMVQADRAMLAAGSRSHRYGGSRTTSYRRSFLIAYAMRIGERLRETADAVAADTGPAAGGALVPLLKARAERVDSALAELFPETVTHRLSVGNLEGWAEGRAAADAAQLDVARPLEQ